jgi:RHS repeat-associated protein
VMDTSRHRRFRSLICLILGLLLAQTAEALSGCYRWAVLDGGVAWGGYNANPQTSVNAWAKAHDKGVRNTGLAPQGYICIRNARYVGPYPHYSLRFEWATWGDGACQDNWTDWTGSPLFRNDVPGCKAYVANSNPAGALDGKFCPVVGDPINPANGNVYKAESDVDSFGDGIRFHRFYNSASEERSALGAKWRHSYGASIRQVMASSRFKPYIPSLDTSSEYDDEALACTNGFDEIKQRVSRWANASASYSGGVCTLTRAGNTVGTLPVLYTSIPTPDPTNTPIIQYDAIRDDGKVISFNVGPGGLTAPPGTALRLQQSASGFTLTDTDNSVETYDLEGRLQSVRTRAGVVYSLTYDSEARLISVVDSFGHQLSLEYDSSGRLSKVSDPAARSVQYGYDSAERLSTVTNADFTSRTYLYEEPAHPHALTGLVDEMGNRYSTWTYDAQGRATGTYEAGGANAVSLVYNSGGSVTTTHALGGVNEFTYGRYGDVSLSTAISGSRPPNCPAGAATTYSDAGFLSSSTDFNGNVTNFSYDDVRGLETSRTEGVSSPHARSTSTTWHSTFRRPTLIVEPSRSTSFSYDGNGNLLTRTITDTEVTNNTPRTWTYTYDSYGRVLTEDGPRTDVNDVTTYTYYTCSAGGACGQLHTVTNAAGHVTTFSTYNAYGDPLTIIDPNSVVRTMTYDARRRVKSISVANETTSFDYWPSGLLRRVRLPDASYLLYAYDAAHRLKTVEDGEGNRIEYALDAMGNRTAENVYDPSNALVRTHSRVFNTLGQLWKDVRSAGSAAVTTTSSYDGEHNVTESTAPLSRTTAHLYDELNRLKQITDPGTGETAFGYDDNDNLASVTDPRNLTTAYSYNGFGDLVQQVSPDTGTTHNTFDDAGNLKTSTDARGITGTYNYDALDRLLSIAYPDQSVSFTYDSGTNGTGRLTGALDANHSVAWSYDSHGRVTSATQVVGGVTRSVGYGYQNGNLTSIATPSGQTVSYNYSNGRIASVSVNNVMVLNDVLYDPFGPPRQWTWANGSIAVRTHDLDGNLAQLDSGGEFYEYAYDDASRISGISNTTSSARSWAYGYDSNDRLTSASSTSRSESWTYDANGNRLTESGSTDGQPHANTYTPSPTSNRLSSIAGSRANSYSYDEEGNVTAETNPARPVEIGTTSTVTYRYNALSQRVWKSGPEAPTYFVYDQAGHLLGEYGSGGVLIQETVWLDDLPIATLRPKVGGGVEIFYVHVDHLGAVRKVSRPSDNVLMWRWDPTSFGTGVPDENPQMAGTFRYNLRFPGQYYDAESGVHYNYFRDGYDPTTGRYTQSDPVGLIGGINTYSYALNDPIGLYDPYGLWVPPSLPQSVVDTVTGFGDGVYGAVTLGFGDLQDVRDTVGVDGGVDGCSLLYRSSGIVGGFVGTAALGGSVGAFTNEMRLTNTFYFSNTRNWIMNNVFRWSTQGKWKGGSGPHFHLAPAMQHHLPQQFNTWWNHSKAIVRRWF